MQQQRIFAASSSLKLRRALKWSKLDPRESDTFAEGADRGLVCTIVLCLLALTAPKRRAEERRRRDTGVTSSLAISLNSAGRPKSLPPWQLPIVCSPCWSYRSFNSLLHEYRATCWPLLYSSWKPGDCSLCAMRWSDGKSAHVRVGSDQSRSYCIPGPTSSST